MTQKFAFDNLPEVFVSDTASSDQIFRLKRQGKIRKLASKLYTTNLHDEISKIVDRNLWQIVGLLFPGALISDRTAIVGKSTKDGEVFIVSDKKRAVKIADVTIKPRRGMGPIENDSSFMGGLYFSSLPRALLENMRSSKSVDGAVPRTLSQAEMEEVLDKIIRTKGERSLNKIRDDIRTVSRKLKLDAEFKQINKIIGSLLQTTKLKLKTPLGIARKGGEPYDPKRIELFNKLFNELSTLSPNFILCNKDMNYRYLYFFEAYFSNFIEGTEFEVEEARDIVFKHKIPRARADDAHDVTGTYKIVASVTEMNKVPKNYEELIGLLKSRHKTIMEGRAEKNPGRFKEITNRAGNTIFVAPELMYGTFKRGFDFYKRLEFAFARAVFMMFMVTEIHPFDDGNGRVARIMMNAELVSNNEQRIIIPTVYRNNYLSSLKALSQNEVVDAIVKVLAFAQKYTNSIDWNSFDKAMKMLTETNAFVDPGYADAQGIRLVLP